MRAPIIGSLVFALVLLAAPAPGNAGPISFSSDLERQGTPFHYPMAVALKKAGILSPFYPIAYFVDEELASRVKR